MNLKQAQLHCRQLGLTLRKRDGEYRVAYRGPDNEDGAYYTNDLDDAIMTAEAMVAPDAQRALKGI